MLELMDVTAGYGKKAVLQHASAIFENRKITAIIGPNGCGKTTLLKTVIGLLPITEGAVLTDGQSLLCQKQQQIARRIAYLAQERATPAMTVEQLVLHGRFAYLSYPRIYSPKDRQIASAAMERMGLSALAQAPLSQLSGGMRQSAYIAMALAQCSDHILLDEPTASLDIAHRIHLMQLLRQLAEEGKCVVAVVHDLPLAMEFAHEILLMQEGKCVLQGTPDTVFRSGAIREIFGISLERTPTKEGYAYYCSP